MKWTNTLSRMLAACAVLALLAATAKPAKAGSLSADTIALFPKEYGGVCLCGFEEGANDEVVPCPAGADAAGTLPAI